MKQYLKKYHIALFGFTVIMSVVMSFLLGLVSSFKDYEIVGNQVVEIKGNNLIMFLSIGIPFLLVQRAAGMIFSSSLQPKMQAYLLSVGMKKEDMYHADRGIFKKTCFSTNSDNLFGFSTILQCTDSTTAIFRCGCHCFINAFSVHVYSLLYVWN
ncbi:hypothetical protein MGH68_00410 [Erysipelothrix sp. D19-032]